ncbi:MAG: hypothetical protein M0Z34_03915 [Nitrospiraceae bacterium]|nr:hypothetical protein [Nitrospiraceae bacterium]
MTVPLANPHHFKGRDLSRRGLPPRAPDAKPGPPPVLDTAARAGGGQVVRRTSRRGGCGITGFETTGAATRVVAFPAKRPGGVKVGAQGADYLYGLTNGARLD